MEKKEPFCTIGGNVNQYNQYEDFLKKLGIKLPYDPAIPLLGIHTEETRIERDTCTPMCTAALLTIRYLLYKLSLDMSYIQGLLK